MKKMPAAVLTGLRVHTAEGILLLQKIEPVPGLSMLAGLFEWTQRAERAWFNFFTVVLNRGSYGNKDGLKGCGFCSFLIS